MQANTSTQNIRIFHWDSFYFCDYSWQKYECTDKKSQFCKMGTSISFGKEIYNENSCRLYDGLGLTNGRMEQMLSICRPVYLEQKENIAKILKI